MSDYNPIMDFKFDSPRFIPKEKYPKEDIGELLLMKAFRWSDGIIRFVQQEFDKRQYWLEITNGHRSYFTTITWGKWKKMSLETKYSIVKLGFDKLYEN